LNSSLAQSAAELWLAKFDLKWRFLSKGGFLSYKFGPRYASKSIKGSKDADHSLASKKRKPKNGSLGWRSGPDKLAKNAKTCPYCDVTPRKPPIKKFF